MGHSNYGQNKNYALKNAALLLSNATKVILTRGNKNGENNHKK